MIGMKRLDVYVAEANGFPREYAKRVIVDGLVTVDGKTVLKPAAKIDDANEIVVKAEKMKYVSRGGFKLEKAICEFPIIIKDKICFDIGASTGGFTDCMLQNGAQKVFAIENGSNQLVDSIKNNEKVIAMENTDIRSISAVDWSEKAEFAAVDVSFISLEKIMPYIAPLMLESGEILFLVKPQFEAGKENLNKKGIVREPKIHIRVLKRITSALQAEKMAVQNIDFSPIRGGEGNIEYLLLAKKNSGQMQVQSFEHSIRDVVANAFERLK